MLLPIFFLIISNLYNSLSSNKLLIHKIDSVFLLFNFFGGIDSLDLIPPSPRVRLGSFFNILYGQLKNPIILFFGQGYGAYFYDYFKVFDGIDLSFAFRYEETISGRYGRPHDTIAAVPLSNGLFGLSLLVYLIFKYLSKIKYNFLAIAVLPWLLLTFYYNSQFALVGLVMLYASEKKITLNSR